MPDILYDTRFFLRLYTAKELSLRRRLVSELERQKRRFASAITIHEVYRVSLEEEGREVARMRKATIERDFEIIDVDSDIAAEAAEIKVAQGRDFPLADAIIGATAILRKLTCLTDDEHIKRLKVRTRWV
ncbi:PIN domain-containing protein [Candidatus Bathyarchaeota archaeon]|jgi:predicted nucleic acid-binding protein|nr:PIN domain-containing protein [Candidatus Bathyarchaeota archaeon]